MNTRLSETGFFRENQVAVLSRRSIRTIQDLLYMLPRRYVDQTARLDFASIRPGESVTFIGKVIHAETKFGRRRRLSVRVEPHQGFVIELTFFQGVPYYSRILRPGFEGAFFGKVDVFRGNITMVHPEFESLTKEDLLHVGKIVPVYKITDAMKKVYLSSRVLRDIIAKILKEKSDSLVDPIPPEFLKQNDLMLLPETIRQVHFPKSMQEAEMARRRLAFNELLAFEILMRVQKEKREQLKVQRKLDSVRGEFTKTLLESLPFSLTGDQEKAVQRLAELSQKPHPYGALLQGDVGSGKTLVALLTALSYMEAGYQCAVMAPTEILARQHYRSFLDFLNHIAFAGVDLLLGGEKKSEREAKLARLKTGQTRLIVGTHSLIQKDVEFKNLAFVVIDEQHRFGVEQREALRSKGDNPDFLAMTATPIPRSLALTLYGDLETIVIKEKPPGRKKVDTRLFDESEINAIYRGIKKYVDMGRQAYIVYPLIDEESADRTGWASVMADYAHLEKNVFSEYRLGLLHGRLASEEKDAAMRKFKEGLIQILVSTTVIEVGVDVPNATVMVIRNAEKFGLSQLHQLRGRVGRGEHQSFCILVASSKITEEGKQRLRAMVNSDDGFFLAQEDLRIRGTGELLGTKQAGMSEFKVADLRTDQDVAEVASRCIESHPDLIERIKSVKRYEQVLKKGYLGI